MNDIGTCIPVVHQHSDKKELFLNISLVGVYAYCCNMLLSGHEMYLEGNFIFTHLKLWIASARHNFKWVKIRIINTLDIFLLFYFFTSSDIR